VTTPLKKGEYRGIFLAVLGNFPPKRGRLYGVDLVLLPIFNFFLRGSAPLIFVA